MPLKSAFRTVKPSVAGRGVGKVRKCSTRDQATEGRRLGICAHEDTPETGDAADYGERRTHVCATCAGDPRGDSAVEPVITLDSQMKLHIRRRG